MKVKGRRKSTNVTDLRGPTAGYASRLVAGSKNNTKSGDGTSKLAKEAGSDSIDKLAKKMKRLPTKSPNVFGKSSRKK